MIEKVFPIFIGALLVAAIVVTVLVLLARLGVGT